MNKMDSYKAKVIKASEVIDSRKPVLLNRNLSHEKENVDLPAAGDLPQVSEQELQEKLKAETELHLARVSDESYRKGFNEGVEFQKKEVFPVLDAIKAVIEAMPPVQKNIETKMEEQIVKLALAVAEKIINQEVATRKEVILGVLKGVLKNVTETEGMKIRINPQDFRYIMEIRKDFLQSIDGVRNVIFEEDLSIKRGGAIVETMFGEVDARLESQMKEIKTAMLKL